jgi:hypothetical protein
MNIAPDSSHRAHRHVFGARLEKPFDIISLVSTTGIFEPQPSVLDA